VAFTPLWVLVIASLTARSFFPGMVSTPPEIYGIPLGVVVEAIAMVWMLLGVVLIWDARTRWSEMLTLLLFTVPATFIVVFTPAVVLILQNLG
jgi:hypothetical protein